MPGKKIPNFSHISEFHEINRRIKEVVDLLYEGDVRAFARSVFYPYETVDLICEGIEKPPVDLVISLIMQNDEINPDYIMTGRGNIYANKFRSKVQGILFEAASALMECATHVNAMSDKELSDVLIMARHLSEVTVAPDLRARWAANDTDN